MNKPAFELKASLFTLSVLFLQTHEISEIEALLKSKVGQLSGCFDDMPVIVDFSKFSGQVAALDLAQLKLLLSEFRLIPVALKHVPEELIEIAKFLNWGILKDHKHNKLANTEAEKSSTAISEVVSTADPSINSNLESSKPKNDSNDQMPKPERQVLESRVIFHPVRSGQQIYVQGDITLLNTVSAGAEVLADGNIHSYGILRGRILAGVKGDKEARIFCQKLEAEWISIAGIYKVIEDLDPAVKGKAVQIYLQNEQLKIELLA